MKAYLVDQDLFAEIRKLDVELNGGSDREKDFGHRLWLIAEDIARNDVNITIDQNGKTQIDGLSIYAP